MKTLLIAAAALATLSTAALANSDKFDQRGGIQVLEENYGAASSEFDFAPTASISVSGSTLQHNYDEQRGGRQILEDNYGAASGFDFAPTASIAMDTNPIVETEMERRLNR